MGSVSDHPEFNQVVEHTDVQSFDSQLAQTLLLEDVKSNLGPNRLVGKAIRLSLRGLDVSFADASEENDSIMALNHTYKGGRKLTLAPKKCLKIVSRETFTFKIQVVNELQKSE